MGETYAATPAPAQSTLGTMPDARSPDRARTRPIPRTTIAWITHKPMSVWEKYAKRSTGEERRAAG